MNTYTVYNSKGQPVRVSVPVDEPSVALIVKISALQNTKARLCQKEVTVNNDPALVAHIIKTWTAEGFIVNVAEEF